jgi:GNAT superfamily N-acetyltransferase
LIGFAVVAVDADKRTTELAVLVEGNWQGKGLGVLLSEHLLHSTRRWALEDISSTTIPDNPPFAEMARRPRFLIIYDFDRKCGYRELIYTPISPTLSTG